MGRYYCSDEDSKNLLLLEIEVRSKILSIFDDVIKCVKSFDGKVLNKRLNTALEAIDRQLSVSITDYSLNIMYYVHSNCVKSAECEHGSVLYLYDNIKYLCSCSISDCTTTEKRIISDVIVEALVKSAKEYDEEINELRYKSQYIEEYRTMLSELEHKLKKLKSEIPYAIRKYYNLY